MLLAVVLLLTLCACGKSAAPDVTPAPEPSAESAETLNYDVPCAVTATNVYPFEGGWNIRIWHASGTRCFSPRRRAGITAPRWPIIPSLTTARSVSHLCAS